MLATNPYYKNTPHRAQARQQSCRLAGTCALQPLPSTHLPCTEKQHGRRPFCVLPIGCFKALPYVALVLMSMMLQEGGRGVAAPISEMSKQRLRGTPMKPQRVGKERSLSALCLLALPSALPSTTSLPISLLPHSSWGIGGRPCECR